MEDPCAMSISELQDAIASGELAREAIVAAHAARIDDVNVLTNTFVELRIEEALSEASDADHERGTRVIGRLDGVPVSIKDSFSVAGLHRTDGMKHFEGQRADRDEVVVERLRRAGGLVLGHANVPDLCVRWNTVSGLYGTSRNPRDLDRTVGGSSGGDAGNVAAGLATVGLGADLGGSIRVPASFCGVYGFRPSAGIVPSVPVIPAFPASVAVDNMLTIGPLGRTVADVEAVFDTIAGPHPGDPTSVPVQLERSPGPLRIAVLRRETGAVIDPDIEERLGETIGLLREVGYEVVEGVFPPLQRAPELWSEISGTDLLHSALPVVGDWMVESGRRHIEEMCLIYDLGRDVTAYYSAWLERRSLQEQLSLFMVDYPLVVTPVAGMSTPLLDFDHMLNRDDTQALFDSMRCVMWVNLFGLPSLALPNGIQIVGRRFGERDVLAAGRDVERRSPRVEIATPRAP